MPKPKVDPETAVAYAQEQVRTALERYGKSSPQYRRAAFQLQQTLKGAGKR